MKTVLVIGAYGMIGAAVTRALRAEGHRVIGLGRNKHAALRTFPTIDWFIQDLAFMTEPRAWADVLDEVEYVVMCAGTHGFGGPEEAEVVHHSAVAALASICADTGIGLVHISAAGASVEADCPLLREIGEGDAAIAAFGGDFWILRPGLVLGQTAVAAGRLLRALAAVRPLRISALGRRQVQTVGMPDLTRAVLQCVDGAVAPGLTADLVEAPAHSVKAVIAETRAWLGLGPRGLPLPLPRVLLWLMALFGEVLAALGWQPPLRRAILRRLSRDITGDPGPWAAAGGHPPRPLVQSLALLPALPETRQAAALAQLLPLIVLVLAAIHGASGATAWFQRDAAFALLDGIDLPQNLRDALVYGSVVTQSALALMILMRRTARIAAVGMLIMAIFYLAVGTVFLPALWLDPLGPVVKIPAVMLLAVVILIALPRR